MAATFEKANTYVFAGSLVRKRTGRAPSGNDGGEIAEFLRAEGRAGINGGGRCQRWSRADAGLPLLLRKS